MNIQNTDCAKHLNTVAGAVRSGDGFDIVVYGASAGRAKIHFGSAEELENFICFLEGVHNRWKGEQSDKYLEQE